MCYAQCVSIKTQARVPQPHCVLEISRIMGTIWWRLVSVLTLTAAYPIMENVTQVLQDPRAGRPIKGKHFPIGPGTDKFLYNQDYFEGDIQQILSKEPETTVESRNAVSDPDLLWPSAAIIYKTTDDVGCPDSPQCEILMRAMNHYHARSCIRFKEWTGEKNHVEIFFNSDSGACWSPVGRTGDGMQRLSLGQRCWYLGIVIHELGHAIGFWHEMNRPDRDEWIYVYWANIIRGFSSAFAKHDAKSVSTLGERFDYRSIMMYDEYAFSKDGVSPTLQAKTGEEIGPIWKKRGLSASDVRRLHKLYKCNGNHQKDTFPYDVVCDFNKHTCGFKNGGSSVWNWRTVNATDGYVYSSYDQAGVTPGYFMSVNFHAVVEKDAKRGPLGCVRFWYLLLGDGNASLKLSHAYLDRVTQLLYDTEKTFDLWLNDTVAGEWVHVDVPMYITRPFKLIFQSQFEEGATYGTIALDDVEILYTACPENAETVSVPLSELSSTWVNSSPAATTTQRAAQTTTTTTRPTTTPTTTTSTTPPTTTTSTTTPTTTTTEEEETDSTAENETTSESSTEATGDTTTDTSDLTTTTDETDEDNTVAENTTEPDD